MTLLSSEYTKVPRWINTDAGRWAWHADDQWRVQASNALSVSERSSLLSNALTMWQAQEQQDQDQASAALALGEPLPED